jgi:alkylated DNA nucleotide flippase Atl1
VPNDGFDWSAIDDAIRAIPAGRWATYGNLAEVGGTAAAPVGAYCASSSAPTAAYQVLANRGEISAGFRWTDPSDMRDVRTVLREEGVSSTRNTLLTKASGYALPTHTLYSQGISHEPTWSDPF